MKDPAFLFYSKDFYEGTRTMLPEERACYIDLIIYQHQHEYIPNDIKRILLYCNGVDEATLKATLEAKFKLCDMGWYNEKLKIIIEERKQFSEKQSINGAVGQFWKKSKALLDRKQYLKLRECLENKSNTEIIDIINGQEITKAMLIALLEAMLKHLEDANAIVNNFIYSKFYDEQIEISNNDSNYLRFVKFLFGENELKRPLNAVLSIRDQIQYSEFIDIRALSFKLNVNIYPTLINMENYRDTKKYLVLSTTLKNWITPKK